MLQVTRVSSKSIKVKIPKPCLHSALQSSDSTSHLVYVWKNNVPRLVTTTPSTSSSLRQTDTIQIATWNCRGLHNSIPYIKLLISKGTDILVLQEHWLWPFEMDQLESIDPNYTHTAVCDNRLSPTSTLGRGCGGCAILWKKTIPATLVSNLESDRICGIQLPLEGNHSALTILGAYICLVLISLKRFTMHILPPLTKPLPTLPPLPHFSLSVISIVI